MSDTKTKEAGGLSLVLRIFASSVALLLTASFVFLVYHQLHIRNDGPVSPMLQHIGGGIIGLVQATMAALCWWYALRGHLHTKNLLGRIAKTILFTLLGGIIGGGFGFAIGFFGPLLVDKIRSTDSPQGPLLGIFVTGPLGFVAGLIGGLVYALICGSKQRSQRMLKPPAPPILPKT
jgi:hypothetical protein